MIWCARVVALAIVTSLLCLDAVAEEASHLRVPLLSSGCPTDEIEGLQGMMAIELSALSPEHVAWVIRMAPRVQLVCSETQLKIEIIDANLNTVIAQRVELNDAVTSDLKRFLGITIIELLAAGASGQTLPQALPRTSPSSPPSAPSVKAKWDPVWRWQLTAVLRTGGKPFWTSYGAALIGEHRIVSWLIAAAEFQFSIGQEEVRLGSIRTDFWSGALYLLSRFTRHVVAVRPGIGFRAGAVSWNGEPDDPQQATGHNPVKPWGGPCFALMTGIRVVDPLELSINIEVGAAVLKAGALVDGHVVLAVEGVWIMFKIGLSVSFDKGE